ncbi:MAG: type 2 isopentenyl-diphosphate Delta-isomerase [Crenarchaeota archaeon]|nr:type 2 isopentenyl-diphosphate Delta-isomerase [Thermoproteota archaeon]
MRGGDAGRTMHRKLDHIRIAIDSRVEHDAPSLLGEVELVHRALPEADLDSVRLETRFLGKRLAAPLMITGMTGGHSVAEKINCVLAEAAAEAGVAMGVGSQRAAIENPSLASTFASARRCGGGELVLVANIGAPQLVKGYSVEHVVRAVEMIDADAVAVHLNAAQEAFQPEGDTDYSGVLEALERLAGELPVPVIVKETGHGIGYEAALALRAAGIRYLDVSGVGGTSWVRVEMYRALEAGRVALAEAARVYSSWGIPTAQAVVEARWAAPDACIIASGGVRSGLDAAKALALGADLAGAALPFIRAYAEAGREGVSRLLDAFRLELRAALFLTGSRSVEELRRAPLLVGPLLESRLRQRGVDLGLYLRRLRGLSRSC